MCVCVCVLGGVGLLWYRVVDRGCCPRFLEKRGDGGRRSSEYNPPTPGTRHVIAVYENALAQGLRSRVHRECRCKGSLVVRETTSIWATVVAMRRGQGCAANGCWGWDNKAE